MTSKALILVWNNFTNDKRVINISSSFIDIDYRVLVIAAKEYQGLPTYQKKGYVVNRIPLFSSLYSKNQRIYHTIDPNQTKSSLFQSLKNNYVRIVITAFLNWITFNVGVLNKGLSYRPNLVYANDLDTLTIAYIIARIFKAKLIYDSHEIWLHGNKFDSASWLRKKWWIFIEKRLIKKANTVIVTTSYRADYLKKYYSLNHIEVIRNCPRFENIQSSSLLRDEFNIKSDQVVLLYQGLLIAKRGIFSIIDAVTDYPEVSVVFMGMGKDMQDLISYIDEKGVNDRVFVKDAVSPNQLLAYTASADIGLQLLDNSGVNHYSTISNKLFEYIMAGLAIIASDFPEIRNIVVNNELGLVVDPDDGDAIKKAIKSLITNTTFLKQCKFNSRKIRSKYTWENEEIILRQIERNLRNG